MVSNLKNDFFFFLSFLLDWIFNGQQFWGLHGCKAFPCIFKIIFHLSFIVLKFWGLLKKGVLWNGLEKVYRQKKKKKMIDVADC